MHVKPCSNVHNNAFITAKSRSSPYRLPLINSNNPFAAFPALPCPLLSLHCCSFSLCSLSCLLSSPRSGLVSAAGLTLCTGGELRTSYPSTVRDSTPVLCVGGAKCTGAAPRVPIGRKGSRFAFTKTGCREGEDMVIFGTRCAGVDKYSALVVAAMVCVDDPLVRSASGDEDSS